MDYKKLLMVLQKLRYVIFEENLSFLEKHRSARSILSLMD